MEVAASARLRNLVLHCPGSGLSWNEKSPPVPSKEILASPISENCIVLFIVVPNGGCVTADDSLGMKVSELQLIITELQEQDADFVDNAPIDVRIAMATRSSCRWIPTRTLARYTLRREITVANLLRMLRGDDEEVSTINGWCPQNSPTKTARLGQKEPLREAWRSLDSAEDIIRAALMKESVVVAGTGAAAATSARRSKLAEKGRRKRSKGLPRLSPPKLGSYPEDSSMLRDIENGMVTGASRRNATNRLNAFFSGIVDQYECSWKHTKGAQYCKNLFGEQHDKHHVRHSALGGQRVAAREFADPEPPKGTLETVYANGWATFHGNHFHRKSRGRMATVCVVPVYEDNLLLSVGHVGPVASWFTDAVHFAGGGPRPGERIIVEPTATHPDDSCYEDGIRMVCFAGAKLFVDAKLPGYVQTSHLEPIALLRRHAKFDDGLLDKESPPVGTVHLLQKVTFKKLPIHVKVVCEHEAGGLIPSAVLALACEVVPSDMPGLIERVEQDLEAEVRGTARIGVDARHAWWKDKNGLLEMPIAGRQPDGSLRVWMRLEDGVSLQQFGAEMSPLAIVDDTTGNLIVRGAYDVRGRNSPALLEIPVRIRRPQVKVTLRLEYAPSRELVSSVRVDGKGRYIPRDDDVTLASPQRECIAPCHAARWRLAARLARRKFGETSKAPDDWLIRALKLFPEEPAPVEPCEAGFIITIRNPGASVRVPTRLLLGYIFEPTRLDEISKATEDVHLVDEEHRWPKFGWSRSTSLTLRFRKLPARMTLDVRDFSGVSVMDAIDLDRTTLNDRILGSNSAELDIPGNTPFARWVLDACLTEGIRLYKAAVQIADGNEEQSTAFTDVEKSLHRHPSQWQQPFNIFVPLQAGAVSAVRLYVALPPVRLEIIPINAATGQEICDGKPGWLLNMIKTTLMDDKDERYGFEEGAWAKNSETFQEAARMEPGKITLLVHRYSCLKIVPGAMPRGFENVIEPAAIHCVVPSGSLWPETSWEHVPPYMLPLSKKPAILRLAILNDATNESISKRLIGDIHVSTVDFRSGATLVLPAEVGARWRGDCRIESPQDILLQFPVPGFAETCDVVIQIELADGTKIGPPVSSHLEAGGETRLSMRLPLESTAPRVVVAPCIDDADGDSEPLRHDIPGWLFEGAFYHPAPPLDIIKLAGGGIDCRITKDTDVYLSDQARDLLKKEVLPGYDVVESDSFSDGILHIRFPRPLMRQDLGDVPDAEANHGLSAADKIAQVSTIQEMTGSVSGISVKISKQPATVLVCPVWRMTGSPAPICGLNSVRLDERQLDVTSKPLATSLDTFMLIPGRGTREKAPTIETRAIFKASRGWQVASASSEATTKSSQLVDGYVMLSFLAIAGSQSTVTVVFDDSALWSRLTRIWLSRTLAAIFRRSLATLQVNVMWECTRRRAPITLLKSVRIGASNSLRDSLCLIGGKVLRSREWMLSTPESLPKGALKPMDVARTRLLRRLSERSMKQNLSALSISVFASRTSEARSFKVDAPRDRSWRTRVEYSDGDGDDLISLTANETTTVHIFVSDEPLWRRLSQRRFARHWRTAFETQTVTVKVAVLPADSECEEEQPLRKFKGTIPLDGGDWLLNSLQVTPSKYAASFLQEPGCPVRIHATAPYELLTNLSRPGFVLACVEVCSASIYPPEDEADYIPSRRYFSKENEDPSNKMIKSGTLPLERAVVRILFRRQVATLAFEIVFHSRLKRKAPIESIQGIGLAAMPGRRHETSMELARPAREWTDKRELSVVLLTALGSPDEAPETDIQVAVASSRSWEIQDILSDHAATVSEPEEQVVDEIPSYFATERKCHGKLVLRARAGTTRMVQIRVSDTRLYLGLCLRRFIRRIMPSTSIRPLRWSWSHVEGSAAFEKLYTGALRGDEADPRTWATPARGWTTKVDEKQGTVQYVYTDYTSAQCAGNSTTTKNSASEARKRQTEWRKALVERRRRKAAHAERLRERSAEERAIEARKDMDAVDLLKCFLVEGEWQIGSATESVEKHAS